MENETGYSNDELLNITFHTEAISHYPGNKYIIFRSKTDRVIFVADRETRTLYLLNNQDALWDDIQVGFLYKKPDECYHVFADTQYYAEFNEYDEFDRFGRPGIRDNDQLKRMAKEIRQKYQSRILLTLPARCVTKADINKLPEYGRKSISKSQESFRQYIAKMSL